MICIMLNDLYYIDWFVLRWMIWTTLHDLYSVELFVVQRWFICTTLNDLYYVEWFVLRWIICKTLNDFLLPCKICATSKGLYSVDWFVLRWMTRSEMDDLYNIESFGLRWNFWVSAFQWVPGVLIQKNTVRYFALTSELVCSWFKNVKKKYSWLCPRNWS